MTDHNWKFVCITAALTSAVFCAGLSLPANAADDGETSPQRALVRHLLDRETPHSALDLKQVPEGPFWGILLEELKAMREVAYRQDGMRGVGQWESHPGVRARKLIEHCTKVDYNVPERHEVVRVAWYLFKEARKCLHELIAVRAGAYPPEVETDMVAYARQKKLPPRTKPDLALILGNCTSEESEAVLTEYLESDDKTLANAARVALMRRGDKQMWIRVKEEATHMLRNADSEDYLHAKTGKTLVALSFPNTRDLMYIGTVDSWLFNFERPFLVDTDILSYAGSVHGQRRYPLLWRRLFGHSYYQPLRWLGIRLHEEIDYRPPYETALAWYTKNRPRIKKRLEALEEAGLLSRLLYLRRVVGGVKFGSLGTDDL